MASCHFCKVEPEEQLKNCVCKKVSYCSKECQAKDWKSHKPSCPPFLIREAPGKGKGLFATRKIKEGEMILEEYPLLTVRDKIGVDKFRTDNFPNFDENIVLKV